MNFLKSAFLNRLLPHCKLQQVYFYYFSKKKCCLISLQIFFQLYLTSKPRKCSSAMMMMFYFFGALIHNLKFIIWNFLSIMDHLFTSHLFKALFPAVNHLNLLSTYIEYYFQEQYILEFFKFSPITNFSHWFLSMPILAIC